MKFKSLSATALERAIGCAASFQVTHVDYAADEAGSAASLGTALHDALELWVRHSPLSHDVSALVKLFDGTYQAQFGVLDRRAVEYQDGLTMIKNWFSNKPDFSTFEVLLLEVKENFPVKLPDGSKVPFNYKWDRFDRLEDGVYRVVDYKSQRLNLTSSDLRNKLQARCYSLAARIRHPDAQRIWVEFDLLRYGRVATVFTREDDIETWNLIKSQAKRLYEMSEEEPEERLSAACRFCVRKASCETLQSNIKAGGIESLEIHELVDLRDKVGNQVSSLASLVTDLDNRLLEVANNKEILLIEGKTCIAEVTSGRSNRVVTDPTSIAMILGPGMAAEYNKFNISEIDMMLKDPRLTDEQKRQIKIYINKDPGKLKIKTREK